MYNTYRTQNIDFNRDVLDLTLPFCMEEVNSMSIYSEEELAKRQLQWEEVMKNAPKVGDPVVVTNEVGVVHHGLVTAVHGPQCVNVVYVSADDTKRDPNGRQIERLSSLAEKGSMGAAPQGRFYERV